MRSLLWFGRGGRCSRCPASTRPDRPGRVSGRPLGWGATVITRRPPAVPGPRCHPGRRRRIGQREAIAVHELLEPHCWRCELPQMRTSVADLGTPNVTPPSDRRGEPRRHRRRSRNQETALAVSETDALGSRPLDRDATATPAIWFRRAATCSRSPARQNRRGRAYGGSAWVVEGGVSQMPPLLGVTVGFRVMKPTAQGGSTAATAAVWALPPERSRPRVRRKPTAVPY
jgi:hypothetical protein